MRPPRFLPFVARYAIGVSLALIALANWQVYAAADGRLYQSVAEIPFREVGLVLGTSPYNAGGGDNPYFSARMNAAAELYHAGRVRVLLVSGSGAERAYNEPQKMTQALIELGVPTKAIYQDYAGFRTLDSVVRAHAVFGLRASTVISQRFHNARAIYLSESQGLDLIGFNAEDVPLRRGPWPRVREYFARVLAVLDIGFLGTEPRYLGDPISIPG